MNTNTDITTAVRRLHFAQNKSVKEISTIWGISQTKVNLILKNKKMENYKKTPARIHDKSIVRLRKQGLTYAAISDRVGVSLSTVKRAVDRNAKPTNPVAKQVEAPAVTPMKPNAYTEYSILWGAFKFRKSNK
jgi:lambda repressor-like predicted transcriptional regulator